LLILARESLKTCYFIGFLLYPRMWRLFI
jgi:hypothetical protein